MKHQAVKILSAHAAVLISFLPSHLAATGFRLPDQDAFAVARGEAFVATANNPSAVYYNPAGITQLEGQNLRTGLYGLDIETTYNSPFGGSFENERDRHVIPQFFYTFSPDDVPLSFGVGVFSPFGLSSRWPDDTGFRTVATQGSIQYLTINPVVAWKVRPDLSIAAGLTFNDVDLDLQQGLIWPDQPFDRFMFKGDGWDVGFNLGAMWKPHEKVSLGVSYRSETTVGLEGETEYYNTVAIPGVGVPSFPKQEVDADLSFPFPSLLIFGVSYRPTPDWNLEFNADYADWSRLGTVNIKQENGFDSLIPQDVPITLDWESSWYYEFGVTHYMKNGWSVSAGYIYNENSVSDAHYSPLVADLNRHFLSVGAGYQGKILSFDIAYQYGYGPKRTVSGSEPSGTGQTADGEYGFRSHALAASVGWHF